MAILLLVVASDCSSPLDPVNCTDELRMRTGPASASVAVGQKLLASIEFSTCGGRTILPDQISWSSQDTTVARVGATTGEVIGLKVGATTVTGRGALYGLGPPIPITVRP